METIESQKAGIPQNEIGAAPLSLVNTENAATDTECSPVSNRAPFPWIGALTGSCYSVMAVVNEEGYLVPVCTAGDLLRACKIIWQAGQHQS
ncbi:MAG TPA: hypothetical protein VF452_08270 [Candidatus Binatia bacterium]